MSADQEKKITSGVEKIASNIRHRQDPELHTPISEPELHKLLIARGSEWRVVWESIPTDEVFDQLYAGYDRPFTAFLYNDVVFARTEEEGWEGPDFEPLDWLIDNPPVDELVVISDLYQHSRGLNMSSSVWTLFQYIVGMAVTSQGMGLNSLMGIGNTDAVYLGRALEAWGEHADSVAPYIELILVHGGE